MVSKANIDYESLEEVLTNNDCETTAVELQAILCGMLAASNKAQLKYWKTTLTEIMGDDLSMTKDTEDCINSLFEWTDFQMNEQDSLAPTLLPGDAYPAIDQLEAIVDWCQGFLLGFGLQTGNQTIENPDVKESLMDIADISQLELVAEEDESTQEALFTLIEHIRVAVQIIHWEMVLKNQVAPNNQTLH